MNRSENHEKNKTIFSEKRFIVNKMMFVWRTKHYHFSSEKHTSCQESLKSSNKSQIKSSSERPTSSTSLKLTSAVRSERSVQSPGQQGPRGERHIQVQQVPSPPHHHLYAVHLPGMSSISSLQRSRATTGSSQNRSDGHSADTRVVKVKKLHR